MDETIYEQPLEIKYCPGLEINLHNYVFMPYKATSSRTIIDKFSFGKKRQAEPMDHMNAIITTVEDYVEPEDQEEGMVGDGSLSEDHPYHGIQVMSAPNTPTLPERGGRSGRSVT